MPGISPNPCLLTPQAMRTPVTAALHIRGVTLGVWWDRSIRASAPTSLKTRDGGIPHPLAHPGRPRRGRLALKRARGGAGRGLSQGRGPRRPVAQAAPPPSLLRSPSSGAAELSSLGARAGRLSRAPRRLRAGSLRRSPAQLPARPPPRPAPPRPVHCSPRAGAGQVATCRGSERCGGAGSQGPAEESGGPGRLPEGRPRVDAAGAGSLEQPAPSLPLGALWLEGKRRQYAGTGGPGPGKVAGRGGGSSKGGASGTRSLSGHSGAVCQGTSPPEVGLSPRTLRRAASPGVKGTQRLSPLPPSWHPSCQPGANPRSGHGWAVPGQPPGRAPGASPVEPPFRRAAGSRPISGGHFPPGTRARDPKARGRSSGRPGGRRVVLSSSAFVRPETFQFLRTEAKGREEADSGSTLPRLMCRCPWSWVYVLLRISPFEIQSRREAGVSDPSRPGNGGDDGSRGGG